jgi:hypothetical protein
MDRIVRIIKRESLLLLDPGNPGNPVNFFLLIKLNYYLKAAFFDAGSSNPL